MPSPQVIGQAGNGLQCHRREVEVGSSSTLIYMPFESARVTQQNVAAVLWAWRLMEPLVRTTVMQLDLKVSYHYTSLNSQR